MPKLLQLPGRFGAIDDGGLVLANMVEADVTPALVGWMNDKSVTHYLEAGKKAWDTVSCTAWLHQRLAEKVVVFTIQPENMTQAIGTLTFRPGRITGIIGLMIGDKDQWGKGYGTRAVLLACWWGQKVRNLHGFTAGVLSDNKASQRVFEKAGFELLQAQDRGRGGALVYGRWMDGEVTEALWTNTWERQRAGAGS